MQSRCLRALNKTTLASPRLSSLRPFSSSDSNKPPSDGTVPPLIPPTPVIDTTPSKRPLTKPRREEDPRRFESARYHPSKRTQDDILAIKEDSYPPRVRFKNPKLEARARNDDEEYLGAQKPKTQKTRKYGPGEEQRAKEEKAMAASRLRADPNPHWFARRQVHLDDEEAINPGVLADLKLRVFADGDGWGVTKRHMDWVDKMEEIEKKGGQTVSEQFMKGVDYQMGDVTEDEAPDDPDLHLNEIYPLWEQEGHPLQWEPRMKVMEEFKQEFFAENDWPIVSPAYVSEEKKKRMDEVEDYPLLQKLLQRADEQFYTPTDEEAYWRSHDPHVVYGNGELPEIFPPANPIERIFPSYQYSCVLWSKARTRKYETGFKQKHTAMIVAGNGKGVGGFGIGKAQTSEEAFNAALMNIEKNLFYVPLFEGRTLPQPVVGQMNETKVIITPMRKGGGLKGADYIHEVFRCWGITDCNVKIINGKNRYSLMYALWDALARQTTLRSEAMRRGVNYQRWFVSGHYGDYENPKTYRYPTPAEVKEKQQRIDKIFKHAFRIYEERSDDINRQIAEETGEEALRRLSQPPPEYLPPISNRKPYHRK